MLKYKACHTVGLDYSFYKKLERENKLKTLKKNYYLYIHDYVLQRELKDKFFDKDCDENNTWNYNLDYKSTEKDSIIIDSIKFNFGNYQIDKNISNNEKVIVKAKGHKQTHLNKGQAHLVDYYEYKNYYNKNNFVAQRILKSNPQININEEINVFVVRDLNSRELYQKFILCSNDLTVNINRKFSNCNYKIIDENILNKEEIENLIQYINFIKFDYGRIEMIKDHSLGWCIIDVNNSPGNGPISDLVIDYMKDLFYKIISY